jgi:nitrogen fixation protein FixH
MSNNANLAYFTLLIIGVVTLLTYLASRSGRGYSVEDTKAHAEHFADGIEEGRGGLTAFCWVTIGAILVWSVIYFIMHWSEFTAAFSHAG